MKNEREEILNELKQIAPTLAGVERVDILGVPENYFSGIQSRIFDAIKAGNAAEELKSIAPGLAAISKVQEREVSAGYFSSLSSNVLGKIRMSESGSELEAIAPALAAVSKAKEAVTAGYFSQMQSNVLKQVKQAGKPAEASVLQRINTWVDSVLQPLFSPQLTFAMASVLTVVLVGWLAIAQNNKPASAGVSFTAAIEKVSRDEVKDYIAANMDEFDYSLMAKNAPEVKNTIQIDESVANDDALLKELMSEINEDDLFGGVES
jgi:DNA-binding FrmR family transcriptional regulator